MFRPILDLKSLQSWVLGKYFKKEIRRSPANSLAYSGSIEWVNSPFSQYYDKTILQW